VRNVAILNWRRLYCILGVFLCCEAVPAGAFEASLVPNASLSVIYREDRGDNIESTSSLAQRYRLGASGFVSNPQLMQYVVSGYLEDDSAIDANLYGIDIDITLLNLRRQASWNLKRLPHPYLLRYSKFSAGDYSGDTYGFGLSWQLPFFIRFLDEDRLVKLAYTSGLPSRKAKGGTREDLEPVDLWATSEGGGDLEEFGELDEGWGDEEDVWEAEEDLGPVGWGDGQGLWEAVEEVEVAAKKEEKRKGPRFAVPFPYFGLDYDHFSYATAQENQSSDYLNSRMRISDEFYDLGVSWDYQQRQDSNRESSSGHELQIEHEYREPVKRNGDRESSWTLGNLFRRDKSLYGGDLLSYTLKHHWLNQYSRAKSISIRNYFSAYQNDDVAGQVFRLDAEHNEDLSTTLTLETDFTGQYNRLDGGESIHSESLSEALLWKLPRLTGYATFAILKVEIIILRLQEMVTRRAGYVPPAMNIVLRTAIPAVNPARNATRTSLFPVMPVSACQGTARNAMPMLSGCA